MTTPPPDYDEYFYPKKPPSRHSSTMLWVVVGVLALLFLLGLILGVR